MTRNEKILIAVMVIALIGVFMFRVKAPENKSLTANPNDVPTPNGPAYLTYNLPWGFSSPVQNVLPNRAAGQIGSQDNPAYDLSSCGCAGSA